MGGGIFSTATFWIALATVPLWGIAAWMRRRRIARGRAGKWITPLDIQAAINARRTRQFNMAPKGSGSQDNSTDDEWWGDQ